MVTPSPTWSPVIDDDTYYMKAALERAREGLGRVAPNPAVGCVIVKNGKIIAAARTQDGGRPHAEIAALEQAGPSASGATAYVTLEPCYREGGACCSTDLIKSGIARVVIGCADRNPSIHGRGIAALKAAGIDVAEDCLGPECRDLNLGFFLSKTKNRPLVTLKMAVSLDGKIATNSGQSQWITGALARAHVHAERARHDATLTGIGTVLADDPSLTTRCDGIDHKSRRIILDTQLKFPPTARMLETKDRGDIIIFTGKKSDPAKAAQLAGLGVTIHILDLEEDLLPIIDILETLAKDGVTRLMVEAGQGVFTSFLRSGLWDHLHLYRAPVIIGADGMDAFGALGISDLSQAPRVHCLSRTSFGDDLFEHYVKPD